MLGNPYDSSIIIAPDQGEIWCTVLKTRRDDRYQLHCRIRYPSRDTTKKKKTVLYIKQVDAPLNFANSIWIFHLVFWSACAHKHKACLFYWFFTQYMVAFVSFGSLGRLYLGPKERMKKRQAFHLLVGAWSTSRLKITSQYVRNI